MYKRTGPVGENIDNLGGGTYDGGGSAEQQVTINPAWNPVLEILPQELHSQVTPHFQQWDKGVNERFQKVHSEYEPWKPIISSGNDPSQVSFAINLVNTLNEDPATVYNAIGEFYKLNKPAPTVEQGQEPPVDEDPYKAKFEELQKQTDTMAKILIQNREAELAREQEAKLDAEMQDMSKKYGKFDQHYVYGLMAAGMEMEDAVKHYQGHIQQTLQSQGFKPVILGGGGGGLPSQNVDPRKLPDKDLNNYIAQILDHAKRAENR